MTTLPPIIFITLAALAAWGVVVGGYMLVRAVL